jgi:hypothetical protein
MLCYFNVVDMVKAATLMGKMDNIRNACIIASSDLGMCLFMGKAIHCQI